MNAVDLIDNIVDVSDLFTTGNLENDLLLKKISMIEMTLLTVSYEGVNSYIKTFNLTSRYHDWRLPTVDELKTLIENSSIIKERFINMLDLDIPYFMDDRLQKQKTIRVYWTSTANYIGDVTCLCYDEVMERFSSFISTKIDRKGMFKNSEYNAILVR